jgi:hypothetical protein
MEIKMGRLRVRVEGESRVYYTAASKSAPGECGGAVEPAEMAGSSWK